MRVVWFILIWIFAMQKGFCYEYNDFLLRSESTIFPKLLMLETDLMRKKRVKVGVLYEMRDAYIAMHVREEIERVMKKFFGDGVQVEAVEIEEFLKHPRDYDALFVLKLDEKKRKLLVAILQERKVVTFAYDANDLGDGFLFSMDIKNEPIIYLNTKIVQEGFSFVPQLYQLVRFYRGS